MNRLINPHTALQIESNLRMELRNILLPAFIGYILLLLLIIWH